MILTKCLQYSKKRDMQMLNKTFTFSTTIKREFSGVAYCVEEFEIEAETEQKAVEKLHKEFDKDLYIDEHNCIDQYTDTIKNYVVTDIKPASPPRCNYTIDIEDYLKDKSLAI